MRSFLCCSLPSENLLDPFPLLGKRDATKFAREEDRCTVCFVCCMHRAKTLTSKVKDRALPMQNICDPDNTVSCVIVPPLLLIDNC
jgi:hypothetical protein